MRVVGSYKRITSAAKDFDESVISNLMIEFEVRYLEVNRGTEKSIDKVNCSEKGKDKQKSTVIVCANRASDLDFIRYNGNRTEGDVLTSKSKLRRVLGNFKQSARAKEGSFKTWFINQTFKLIRNTNCDIRKRPTSLLYFPFASM